MVDPTFYDLPAELFRHFHALFDSYGIPAEAEPRPDRGSYRSQVPPWDGKDTAPWTSYLKISDLLNSPIKCRLSYS
jgi:hypothetical protein